MLPDRRNVFRNVDRIFYRSFLTWFERVFGLVKTNPARNLRLRAVLAKNRIIILVRDMIRLGVCLESKLFLSAIDDGKCAVIAFSGSSVM